MGAIVGDNDGSAFITKAEFDSLKNNFQSQIDQYNTSIDSKIDGAIAAYLAGIHVAKSIYDQPLFASFYVGKKIEAVSSNDARFFSKGDNMWNLNFNLIQSWDYLRGTGGSTSANGRCALKTWSYNLSSDPVAASNMAKRTLVRKEAGNKWRFYGITSDYYESHSFFGSNHAFMTDYGFNSADLFFVPWRFNVAGDVVLHTSNGSLDGWRTNIVSQNDTNLKNSVIPPACCAWGCFTNYSLTGDFNAISVFDDANAQYMFDVDNRTKLIGNADFVNSSCYDWFLSSRISATAAVSYLFVESGAKITSAGQQIVPLLPYVSISKPTETQLTSYRLSNDQYGKNHYPPVLAPIDIHKSSFSEILAADSNKYRYKDNGSVKTVDSYSLCAGFPFYATEEDETSFKWLLNNAGTSGKIYFKVGPFESGITESDCIYSKNLTSGINSLEFTTDKKSLIWVKWDVGVNIDVDNSLDLLVTT